MTTRKSDTPVPKMHNNIYRQRLVENTALVECKSSPKHISIRNASEIYGKVIFQDKPYGFRHESVQQGHIEYGKSAHLNSSCKLAHLYM